MEKTDSEKVTTGRGGSDSSEEEEEEEETTTAGTTTQQPSQPPPMMGAPHSTSSTTSSSASNNNPLYCSYVDGQFTYKDPGTSAQYVWNEAEKRWVVKEGGGESGGDTSSSAMLVDSNKLAEQKQQTHHHQRESGGVASAGGGGTTEVISPGTSQVQFDGNTYTYTDQDGTVFLWDAGKGAWFPRLDEEFMVRYQLSYGGGGGEANKKDNEEEERVSSSSTTTSTSSKKPHKKQQQQQQQQTPGSVPAPKQPPQWFDLDDSQNTHVYVSNLPLDIDESEFVEFMSKCGLVMKDPVSGDWKVKLYRDAGTGNLKGDGVCTYIKVDSVNLALQILDQSYFKDKIVNVERAKFQLKGQYDPSKKPKQKKKRDKLKLRKQQESLFSWKPEKLRGERGKNEKVVVVKQAFKPEEFEKHVELILELKEDFKEEAGKLGVCRKVDLFDNNVEGALKIHMTTPEEADAVVSNFNGRYFAGRRLEAYIWDGLEKLNVVETEAERKRRLERWKKYVDDEEEGDDGKGGGGGGGGEVKKARLGGEDTPPRAAGDRDSDDDDESYFE